MVTHGHHLRRAAAFEPLLADFSGLAQPDNAWQVFCAGAALPFVASAIDQRLDQRSLLDIERTGPLRRMDFVSGNRERIAAYLMYVDCDLAGGLHRVCMKEDIGISGDFPDLLHRLYHARLIVRHHDADQPSVRSQRTANIARIDLAPDVHSDKRDLAT